jgi:hypothetical protein
MLLSGLISLASVSGRVKMSQNWRFKNAVYDEGGTGGAGTVFSSSDTSW